MKLLKSFVLAVLMMLAAVMFIVVAISAMYLFSKFEYELFVVFLLFIIVWWASYIIVSDGEKAKKGSDGESVKSSSGPMFGFFSGDGGSGGDSGGFGGDS